MVTLNAHFDGKVIVPDEPLDLPANQKLRVIVEPIDAGNAAPAAARRGADFSKLLGLGLKGATNPTPRFPDHDSLWEGTTGDYLEKGPNKAGP